MEVQGSRSRGRPRKTGTDNVQDDMRELGIQKDLAWDHVELRRTLDRQTSHGWNTQC